jgi:hypothetical protein
MSKNDAVAVNLDKILLLGGDTLAIVGINNPETGRNQEAKLLEHPKHWEVVKTTDGKEDSELFDNEAEARKAFAKIKTAIEKQR